ncbi:MAG: glycosyltransferase family 2 protein, partial [Actinomycetota bacterium]
MQRAIVIPTLNARDLLARALDSLRAQTVPSRVIVVDNASTDGTAEMVRQRFPEVELVVNDRNLGFGRAIHRGTEGLDADVLVLVNNDVVCAPTFVEEVTRPFADPGVGMVAGVLTQARAPDRIDSAGIELDPTSRAYDYLSDRPVAVLTAATPAPVGPCGGAAAYRLDAYRQVGGFDPAIFAYWEDTDLALRLRAAGWRCALAHGAIAEHHHGATLGAGSPRQRQLDAFGRAFVLAKHGVLRRRPLRRAQAAVLDWPALLVHLVVRREA